MIDKFIISEVIIRNIHQSYIINCSRTMQRHTEPELSFSIPPKSYGYFPHSAFSLQIEYGKGVEPILIRPLIWVDRPLTLAPFPHNFYQEPEPLSQADIKFKILLSCVWQRTVITDDFLIAIYLFVNSGKALQEYVKCPKTAQWVSNWVMKEYSWPTIALPLRYSTSFAVHLQAFEPHLGDRSKILLSWWKMSEPTEAQHADLPSVL